MKTFKQITLSADEALVLQQIEESGEEDIVSLAANLHMSRERIIQLLDRLKCAGLVVIRSTYGDWWVHMSTRGKQLTGYLWPEMIVGA